MAMPPRLVVEHVDVVRYVNRGCFSVLVNPLLDPFFLQTAEGQDHRAIKRCCVPMTGFKSFHNAAVTIAGIELAHRINKRQFSFGVGRPRRERSLKVLWDRALA